MAIAISAKKVKGLRIDTCSFIGKFDPAIDIEGAEDVILTNNKFSDSHLHDILSALAHEISQSRLSTDDKKELFTEIINYLSLQVRSEEGKKSLKLKILKYVGDKAVDLFLQLVSLVATSRF